jgi:hypothetical protein
MRASADGTKRMSDHVQLPHTRGGRRAQYAICILHALYSSLVHSVTSPAKDGRVYSSGQFPLNTQPQASSLQQPLTRIHLWGPGSSPRSSSPKLEIHLEHKFPTIICGPHFVVGRNPDISTYLFLFEKTGPSLPKQQKARAI